jgi:hypothetical protein
MREELIDSRQLLRALIELNIARKNMLSYPEGHHQVAASAQRAFEHLKAVVDLEEGILIGVAREGLLICDQFLDPGNSVIRDLAGALRDRLIVRIAIGVGLSLKDTLSFLRLITQPTEGVASGSPPVKHAPKKALFNSIRVHFIDYANFHHTSDRTIFKKTAAPVSSSERSIWNDYVRVLALCGLTPDENGTPIERNAELAPAELADFFNSRMNAEAHILKTYGQAIQDHLECLAATPIVSASTYEVRKKFNQFIEKLNPNLRKQFLSTTFDHLHKSEGQPAVERTLEQLPHAFVIDMLTQANAEGKEISPTLLNFTRKMAGIGDANEPDENRAESKPASDEWERLPSGMPDSGILKRESYEQFVVPEYDRTLQALIPNQQTSTGDAANAADLSAHVESLTDRGITHQLAHAFLKLIEKEANPDLYREHARNLLTLVPDIIRHKGFLLLFIIVKLFRTHAEGGRPQPLAATARECDGQLKSPKLIKAVLDPMCRSRNPLDPAQIELAISLGPTIVGELLERYLADGTPAARELLAKAATVFPLGIAAELARRLGAAGPEDFADLQPVIALLSPNRIQDLLRPLLDHDDPRIRMAALEILLGNKAPEALARLEAILGSRHTAEVLVAVRLVGKYALTEMVPLLTRMLCQGFLLLRSDLEKKEKIISVFKQLRCPLPLAEIEKSLRRKLVLYPAWWRRIKATLKAMQANAAKAGALGAVPSTPVPSTPNCQ